MGPSKAFDSLQQNFLLVVLRVNLRNGEKIENSQTPISEKHNNSNLEQDLDQDLTRIVTRASVPQLLETTEKIKAINHNGENALQIHPCLYSMYVRIKMYLIKM
jgi:hypothetical protein